MRGKSEREREREGARLHLCAQHKQTTAKRRRQKNDEKMGKGKRKRGKKKRVQAIRSSFSFLSCFAFSGLPGQWIVWRCAWSNTQRWPGARPVRSQLYSLIFSHPLCSLLFYFLPCFCFCFCSRVFSPSRLPFVVGLRHGRAVERACRETQRDGEGRSDKRRL